MIYIYILHWIAAVGLIQFSWVRSRHFLHPHFMFTMMIVIIMSDFLVRGYEDDNIAYIPDLLLAQYQMFILGIFVTTVITTSAIRNNRLEQTHCLAVSGISRPNDVELRVITLVASALVVVEIATRLSAVDWSWSDFVEQSLGQRGQKVWELVVSSGNFVLALLQIVFGFSAIAFAYVAVHAKGPMRILSSLGFLLVTFFLILDGSRTHVMIAFGALWCFFILVVRQNVRRILFTAVCALAVAISNSVMYLYRASGYIANQTDSQFSSIVYHQDDSYYRALYAYYYADFGTSFWDPFEFFSAILANPIPRYFWETKPLLTQEFYGGFKLDYVTISYVGEMVAMFGVIWATILSVFVGFLLYWMFYKAVNLLRYPLGLTSFLTVALYVYMCMRSLFNLTGFMYLPIFAIAVCLVGAKRVPLVRARQVKVSSNLRL